MDTTDYTTGGRARSPLVRRARRLAAEAVYALRHGSATPVSLAAAPGQAPVKPARLPVGAGHTVIVNGLPRRLFFLCGHPRSGTNWTRALLNLHPQVRCDGEYRFEALRRGLDEFMAHAWHMGNYEPVRSVAEACFQDTVRYCMGAMAADFPEVRWVGDQTPRPLEPFIPGAPHVLVVRDGRDVVVSMAFHELTNENPVFSGVDPERIRPLAHRFKADEEIFAREPHLLLADESWVRALARSWAATIEKDLAARAVLARTDTPVLEVRYEQLHEDTRAQRDRMLRFLGLDPTEARSISRATRTRPGFDAESPKGFFRRGAVGDHGRYFTPGPRRWFNDEAAGALIALGYEKGDDW